MKRGIEELGAEFVLDEFHISEYIKRMVLAIGEETAEQEIREIIRNNRKQYRKSHQSYVVSKVKFTADGME